jgi:hypothetical protein
MENRPARLRRKGSPRAQMLLVGGVIGALAGIGAAHLLWEAREKHMLETGESAPLVSSGGLVRIGLLVVGLLRQIGDVARGE